MSAEEIQEALKDMPPCAEAAKAAAAREEPPVIFSNAPGIVPAQVPGGDREPIAPWPSFGRRRAKLPA